MDLDLQQTAGLVYFEHFHAIMPNNNNNNNGLPTVDLLILLWMNTLCISDVKLATEGRRGTRLSDDGDGGEIRYGCFHILPHKFLKCDI